METIEQSHPYVEAIFNASLVAWENDDVIKAQISRYYGDVHLEPYKKNHVQAYGVIANGKNVIAINGTDGTWSDWVNNLNCLTEEGFHRGIRNEFVLDLEDFIQDFTRTAVRIRPDKPFIISGHSQGSAQGQLAVDYQRSAFKGLDTEAIVYCGPRMVNLTGREIMRKNGDRVTHLVMPGDVVDNLGGIELKLWPPKVSLAKHYGFVVELPKVEEHVLLGHKYSVVMKSLKELFRVWKKPEQMKNIDEIAHVAKV